MEKLITTTLSITVLCSCINSTQTEAENDSLLSMTDCSLATECYEPLTKNQLEIILENINPYAVTTLRFTYVDNVDNQNVLTDFTTLLNSTEYHYFFGKNNGVDIIDKIITKPSVHGIVDPLLTQYSATGINFAQPLCAQAQQASKIYISSV